MIASRSRPSSRGSLTVADGHLRVLCPLDPLALLSDEQRRPSPLLCNQQQRTAPSPCYWCLARAITARYGHEVSPDPDWRSHPSDWRDRLSTRQARDRLEHLFEEGEISEAELEAENQRLDQRPPKRGNSMACLGIAGRARLLAVDGRWAIGGDDECDSPGRAASRARRR